MTGGNDSTLTATAAGDVGPAPCDYLFVVLEAARPAAAGARISLADVSRVVIGRGEARAASRDGGTLRVTLPDRRLSAEHAELVRGLAGWELRDLGSKNGTSVDGALVARAAVDPGACIEVGRTLLRVATMLPGGAGDLVDEASARAVPTLEPALAAAFDRVGLAASSEVPVLIEGETGVGKEVLARRLHRSSGRDGPFVAVNCGALPAALVERELFGHRRGAFTGADTDHDGYVRAADGGTLLLDEIADLPAPAQVALLRVLTERAVTPLGSTRPVAVDFRLISATNRDLDAAVASGDFREDLFARLAGLRVVLPPLRERPGDLGLLVAALLDDIAGPDHGIELTAAAARSLAAYHWPRNVRELDSVLRAAVSLAPERRIDLAQLSAEVVAARPPTPGDEAARRRELVALVRKHAGNVSAIARETGKARMQVQRWLKRYAIDPERYRP